MDFPEQRPNSKRQVELRPFALPFCDYYHPNSLTEPLTDCDRSPLRRGANLIGKRNGLPTPSARSAATFCPVMPRIPPAMIPPIGFEPVSLPTLGRGRQHRPGLHLQLALLTGLLVFAGPALRVVSHPYVVDASKSAADGVSACRTLAAGGPALSTLSISSHWRVPF